MKLDEPFNRKMLAEHNEFIHVLEQQLNQSGDPKKVSRALQAVLHTLRDRLTLQQSFHLLAQLPVFMKLFYIDGWRYREKPIKYDSVEAFSDAVEQHQYELGERDFNWDKSTDEITNIILASLKKYLDEGTMQNIFAELPPTLHALFI